MRRALLGIVLLGLWQMNCAAQPVLDLRGLDPIGSSCNPGSFTGAAATRARATLDLAVTYLSDHDLVIGSHVTYEVEITNTGKTPVVLPWASRNPSGGIPGDWCRDAVLSLIVSKEGEVSTLLATIGIGGRADRPETLLTIAPGEKATYRVAAAILPSAGDLLNASGAPKRIGARASFLLQTDRRQWAEVYGSATVTVTLRRPG